MAISSSSWILEYYLRPAKLDTFHVILKNIVVCVCVCIRTLYFFLFLIFLLFLVHYQFCHYVINKGTITRSFSGEADYHFTIPSFTFQTMGTSLIHVVFKTSSTIQSNLCYRPPIKNDLLRTVFIYPEVDFV